MATQVQWRGGSTAEHATFTGAAREITVDTQKKTLVVHDGSTAGGEPLLREDQANLPSSVTNGLYTPGTNQVALSTAGTGRLFVDASGNVGVGAASTGAYFRAVGLTGASIIEAYGADVAGNADVEIKSNGSTGSSRLIFSDTAAQSGVVKYTHSTDSFEFLTAGTEKLRITSDGKVGVGTSAPNGKLDVADGDAYITKNTGGDAAGVTSQSLYIKTQSGNLARLYSVSSGSGGPGGYGGDLRIQTKSDNGALADRVTIMRSGNVGVGTSVPSAAFEISAPLPAIRSTHSLTGDYLQLFHNGSDAYVDYSADDLVIRSASNTERLRITSDGKVGVGTSSPSNTAGFSQQVEIAGTLPCLSISQTNAGFTTRKYSLGVDSVGSLGVWDNAASAYRVLVDSSGRVGIGSTLPQGLLHLAGSGASLYFEDTDSSNTLSRIYKSGSSLFINSRHTSAGQIVFNSENSSGVVSERARLDTSGRLLVGTSSSNDTAGLTPNVQSESGSNNGGLLAWCNAASAFGGYLALGKSRGTTSGAVTSVQNGDTLGTIYFFGADGTSRGSWGAEITAAVDGTPGLNDMPGRLVFSTTADGASSPTERMRIANDGLVYAYGNGHSIFAASAQAAGTTFTTLRCHHSATSTTTGTTSFQVFTNGNVENTNNSYGAISDIKLKENIVDANSQWDDIKALRPVNYNFKEGQTHTQLGLIAQEVELVSPGLVSESPDRDEDGNDLGTVTKSVNYSVLYMKAVKALQEAMERIETLEAKVAALESA